ncbi:NAD synthetase [Carabus blaptoides fortunei]
MDLTNTAVIVFPMCRMVVTTLEHGALSDIRKILGHSDYTPNHAADLCNRLVITYMGIENSFNETKHRANTLAAQIGRQSIFSRTTGLFSKYGVNGRCPWQNVPLQNIQAQWAGQVNCWCCWFDKCDEALRGYLTKYDCSSADINPIYVNF